MIIGHELGVTEVMDGDSKLESGVAADRARSGASGNSSPVMS